MMTVAGFLFTLIGLAWDGGAPGSAVVPQVVVNGGASTPGRAAFAPPSTPDFAISATPNSQAVVAGSSVTYAVTITLVGGFAGVVSFSTSALPSGASASFNPLTVTASGSATMTVATSAGTPTGTANITITGTSGSLQHSYIVALVVNPLAVKLAFSSSPGNSAAGAAFATQPVVLVQDADGNTVTSSSASVMLSIVSRAGTSGAVLSCTSNLLTVSAGVATFSGCKIDRAGIAYRLHAVSGSLMPADSSAFNVSSGSTLSYSVAKTDRNTYSSPAPRLGAAGTFTTDPDFGMRVLRVTQSGSCSLPASAGFSTSGSGAVPMWNKDSTKLMFGHDDSGNWLYQGIDTLNFTTTGPCVNIVPAKLAAFPSFSWSDANRIYGLDLDGRHLSRLDTSSRTVTRIFDLRRIPGFTIDLASYGPYLIEVDRNEAWVCTASASQDLGTQIGCYNMQTGATQVLDLAAATSKQGTNAPVALDNLTSTQLVGCGIHTIGIDASGQWVHFGANGCVTPLPGNSTTQNEIFWQLGTNHIVWQPTRITGHTGLGYNSAFVEGAGQGTDSCPANDYRGWDLWFASDMGTAGSPKWVQANACTPAPNGYGINTDEHVSWLNNVNDSNANRYPLVAMPIDNNSLNCGGLNYMCWEIDALQMGPAVDKWNAGQYRAAVSSATIWRFAHTYNDPTNSQCSHMGYSSPNVSRDGKYAAFPSDWMGQTGTGSCTNSRRTDLFVVELK